MRFAGKRLLALVRRNVVPEGLGGWALEVGPDLGIATIVGATSGNPLLGFEDGVLGLGGSFGGRAAGALIGGMVGGRRGAATGAMVGGMTGGFGVPMLAPRPIADAVRREEEERLLAEQQLREQGIFEQGIMAGAQQIAAGPRVQTADEIAAQLGFYA